MPRKRKQKFGDDTAGTPKKTKKQVLTSNSSPSSKKSSSNKKSTASSSKTSLFNYLKDPGWRAKIGGEFDKDYFKDMEKNLSDLEKKSVQVFPPKDLIFNAFNLTPFSAVKVVILGQDPYHDDDQAHGLSFSVPKGQKVPPSLRNMYKELETDILGFTHPGHGCLEDWAKRGVLLLNATLTVEAHEPNSHGKKKFGWQTFTDTVMQTISDESSGVVFILWGNFAHKKEKLIDTTKHSVIKSAHPSPLSFTQFSGCRCFSKANKALKKLGKAEIDWTLS